MTQAGLAAEPIVGLLYSPGDAFGERRIEMLLGPMLLAGLRPLRFTQHDIDAKTLTVQGQWHLAGAWQPCAGVRPVSILDWSRPASPRLPGESLLLGKVPHSVRIDHDRLDLLDQLQRDPEFRGVVLPSRPLNGFADAVAAAEQWGRFVVKSRSHQPEDAAVLLERKRNHWEITEFFQRSELDEAAFQAWLTARTQGAWMLQKYVPTLTLDERCYALQITVQQRHDGAWMVPAVHCLLATESPFACLQAGAEHIGSPFVPLWVNRVIPSGKKSAAALEMHLQCFGITLARRIEEQVAGRPAALAFKVLLDKNHQPWLANVHSRAAPPSRAARNLEFFKHLADFSIGLANQNSRTSAAATGYFHQTKSASHGLSAGVSVRGQIKAQHVALLLDAAPSWIDVSLAQGGRRLLLQMAAASSADNAAARPFLSLRLGMAAGDAALPDLDLGRLNPLEEFVGSGLLRWSEVTYMRSARVPLLSAQFDLAMRLMPARGADLIWVDDLDLGLRAVPAPDRGHELEKTVQWLDDVCLRGLAGGWGISLFGLRTTEVLNWLNQVRDLSETHGFFSTVCVRAANFNPDCWRLVESRLQHLVLLVVNAQESAWVSENMPNAVKLEQWRAQPTEQDIESGRA